MSQIIYQEDDDLFFAVFFGNHSALAEGVTGVTTGDLTVRAVVHSGTPSLTDITTDVTLHELSAANKPGWYLVEIDTSDATGTGWDAGDTITIFIENDNSPKDWREPAPLTIVCAPEDLQAIDALISSRAAPGDAMDLIAGAVDAAAIATDAIDADALATSAVDEIVDGVWDELQSGHVSAGTFGAFLDVEVSSRAAPGDAMDLIAGAVDAAAIATDAIDADALATSAVDEIVDQVWRELLADHSGVSGSTAEALADAQSGATGGIAQAVWEYDVESVTGFELAGTKLTDVTFLTAKVRRMVASIARSTGQEVE